MSLVDDLKDWQRKLNALPPMPTAILTHHSVPYGGAFRQWDTKGRLYVWVNRGQIADMPRRTAEPRPFSSMPLLGIPVRNA